MISKPYVPLLSPKHQPRFFSMSVSTTLGYRSIKLLVVSLLCFSILASLTHKYDPIRKFAVYCSANLAAPIPDADRPPPYTSLRQWEISLPQHNPNLPFPEGKTGRYVLFSNSRENLSGWNNKLNDMLLNTWLAYSSNRAYVFHDFAWVNSHYPWPVSSHRERAPRTPLNALVSGPSAGAPWDEQDGAPRAVSEAYFDAVCPRHERRIINTRDVKPALHKADGKVIFERWKVLLAKAEERCIEVVPASRQEDKFPETFDIFFWSGPRSISLWDEFVDSPVSRLLGTSPVVNSAIQNNLGLFQSSMLRPNFSSHKPESRTAHHEASRAHDPFSSLFSIHVRRGDFKEACMEHAALNSTFYNWNQLPFLPDKLFAYPGSQQNEEQILERCWPNVDAIRSKVNLARKEYKAKLTAEMKANHKQHSEVLYIMSNDRTEWLEELREAFANDGWERIVMSRDLVLNPPQREVSVAVDMDIGRRSAVFIGNGWSSFTSNVVHRRLSDRKLPNSTRFW